MKAVVYDKWLHSLGGGEVVACNIAKILKDKGYQVLFISGKEISPEIIFEKLKIDLSDIEFKQVWNDEISLKRLVKGSDLFVNISFMDYSIGFAKTNIYYANFPTKPYNDLEGMLYTKVLIPLLSRLVSPVESLSQIEAPVVINKKPAYVLKSHNKYALSNLTIGKAQVVVFKLYLENFYTSFLENINIVFDNARVTERWVDIDHNSNTVQFIFKFIPTSPTTYLNINLKQLDDYHDIEQGKVYLLYPKIRLFNLSNYFFKNFLQRVVSRFRAGIFTNITERLGTYQGILTYSSYAQRWIRKYWGMNSFVIAPPVDLLNKKNNSNKFRKNNWICSVGRFFTLGHGKKQEILIEAFKRFYDKGKKNWQLHLVGGLGDEPTSIAFFKYLKQISKGYPIFFHLNVSRDEVEEVYLKSRIYWHATGFGENETHQPIRFEHFGISPIEAMSAKCIPILFNGGGLVEIINTVGLDAKRNLFKSVDELVDNTIYYQSPKNSKIDWQKVFKRINENYSLEAFKSNFLKFLALKQR